MKKFVKKSLDSVFSQGVEDLETVVVDDGSVDRTAEVTLGYGDSRVRLVSLDENSGLCAARQAGSEAARGEWLIDLDSDDILLPVAVDRRIGQCPAVGEFLGPHGWSDLLGYGHEQQRGGHRDDAEQVT